MFFQYDEMLDVEFAILPGTATAEEWIIANLCTFWEELNFIFMADEIRNNPLYKDVKVEVTFCPNKTGKPNKPLDITFALSQGTELCNEILLKGDIKFEHLIEEMKLLLNAFIKIMRILLLAVSGKPISVQPSKNEQPLRLLKKFIYHAYYWKIYDFGSAEASILNEYFQAYAECLEKDLNRWRTMGDTVKTAQLRKSGKIRNYFFKKYGDRFVAPRRSHPAESITVVKSL